MFASIAVRAVNVTPTVNCLTHDTKHALTIACWKPDRHWFELWHYYIRNVYDWGLHWHIWLVVQIDFMVFMCNGPVHIPDSPILPLSLGQVGYASVQQRSLFSDYLVPIIWGCIQLSQCELMILYRLVFEDVQRKWSTNVYISKKGFEMQTTE